VNQLSITFWQLGMDAAQGLLEARGFQKAPHPGGYGSSLYRLGALHLHSMGMWLNREDHRLVYHRARGEFYQTWQAVLPPGVPEDAVLFPFDEGFAVLHPALLAHERWIADRCGAWHRHAQMVQMPLALVEYRDAWEETLCCAQGPEDRLATG